MNQLNSLILPDFPGFKDWPAIWSIVHSMLPIKMLPKIKTTGIEMTSREALPRLRNNIGTVLWYNSAYQIGAIAFGDGVARAHWSQIETGQRLKTLREGQKVRLKETAPSVNTYKWPRVTNFDHDAIGITPINESTA